MNYIRPELLDRLAAEYVVGTLHGRARRRFTKLLREHASVRLAVEVWAERLAPMSQRLDATAPPSRLWLAIERRINASREESLSPHPEASRASAPRTRWFTRAGNLGALVTGLLLGMLVISIALPLWGPRQVRVPEGRVMPESYAGILSDTTGDVGMLVSSLRRGRVVDIKVLRPVVTGPGQTLQLWALFSDSPPMPLGAVQGNVGKSQITLRDSSETLLSKATHLAVSVETPGTVLAQPAGAFVLKGPCAKFW